MQEDWNAQGHARKVHPGWIESIVQFVNAQEEAIGSFVSDCMELGAVGSVEATPEQEAEQEEDSPCRACGRSTHVQIYFPESAGIQEVIEILESKTRPLKGAFCSTDARARIVRCRRIEREEWETGWKRTFPAEKVSGRFWVVPPWQTTTLPNGAVPILLEPGLAFGTGKHQTTRHCIEFMEELARRDEGFPSSCLDVGCGSGILSIAAYRLGATRVVGLEIDPDAVTVASGNLKLNRLSGKIHLVNGPLECCRTGFELIAANLDARTLLMYQGRFWSLLKKGGLAIVSGLIDPQGAGVIASFQATGFQLLDEKKDHEEGWTSYLLRRT